MRKRIVVLAVAGLVVLFAGPAEAVAASFHFADDFEDEDISDWTTVATGAGTSVVEPSMNRAAGGIYSMHIRSIADGDRAYAIGPAGSFDLDYDKAYTIDFDFNYDKDNDDNGFHFLEVMAMNGPGGVDRQVGLYLDTPGTVDGSDALIYRDDTPANNTVAGLKEDVWYHLAIDVDPADDTYDLTLTSPGEANDVYDAVGDQWVHELLTSDIPFIGDGQADGFFPFRFGDRNADAVTYDHGEAYWDNVVIDGTEIPGPATMSLLALGGLAVLRRRRHL